MKKQNCVFPSICSLLLLAGIPAKAIATPITLNCTIFSVKLNGQEAGHCNDKPNPCSFALSVNSAKRQVIEINKAGENIRPIRSWSKVEITYADTNPTAIKDGQWTKINITTLNRLTGAFRMTDEIVDWQGNIITDQRLTEMRDEKLADPNAEIMRLLTLPVKVLNVNGKCEIGKSMF